MNMGLVSRRNVLLLTIRYNGINLHKQILKTGVTKKNEKIVIDMTSVIEPNMKCSVKAQPYSIKTVVVI